MHGIEKNRKENTTPFGINVMISQGLYRAAQGMHGIQNQLVLASQKLLPTVFQWAHA